MGCYKCELLASSCDLDGFDDKLGEVTIRGLKVNLRKNKTLDGVVMDREPIFVKADKECFIEMALDPQGLGLIYSGYIRGKNVHEPGLVLEDQAGRSMALLGQSRSERSMELKLKSL
ncbi:hypothetical protein Tco_1162979 [Tanacetum coccineum]